MHEPSKKEKRVFSCTDGRISPVFWILLLTVSICAVYSHTLQSPFVFDDFANIANNVFIRMDHLSWESISDVLTSPHPNARRKIAYLSFAFNYLWNGYNPAGYHLLNILIHISCCLLAVLFFYKTLDTEKFRKKYGSAGFYLAWTAAFVWGLHPLQTNAVTYIVQRMTSLAVLFSLLSLIAWIYGREYAVSRSYIKMILCFLLSPFCWVLGMMCKEHVAVLPLLAVVHEFFMLKTGSLKIRWQWIVLILICIAGFLLFSFPHLKGILTAYGHRDFTLWERVMTQFRVLLHYLSLFYFPLPDRFALLHDYPVSRSLFSPLTTVVSILFWFALVITAWIKRRQWPVFAWMTAWFLAAHLIESTIIPLEMVFEHRMYLPSLALAFGTVLLSYDFFLKQFDNFRILLIIFCLVLTGLGYATYCRNSDFGDAITLYRADLKKYPQSRRMRHNLALELSSRGDTAESGKLLGELAGEYPNDIPVQQSWFTYLAVIQKDISRAESVYQHIKNLLDKEMFVPYTDAKSVYHLARFFHDRGLHERALVLVTYLMKYNKDDSLWFLKGRCHIGLGDWESALDAFRQAWEKDPEAPSIIFWYAKSLIQTGQQEKGCALLEKASRSIWDKRAAARSMELFVQDCENLDRTESY